MLATSHHGRHEVLDRRRADLLHGAVKLDAHQLKRALGLTTVMVTHDPRAATIADRILFLADGLIVRDLGPSSAREVIAVSEELAR